ncbi:MAG: site-specific integrase [Oscillospiraceae bacterium]|nr:site-specific integrase [Oscillospiraceae bacterium]
MATITKRGNTYRIKVSCGYDVNGKQVVQSMTYRPDESITATQIRYVRYQQFTKKVYPALGHLRLDKVSTRNVQLFINSLSKDGANEVIGKPLAPKTVRLYQGFISNTFSYAIRLGMLTDNPCSRVTLPKLDNKEKPIYTLEETERFLSLLENEPLQFRVFFVLAVYSGFRRGELLGIEWKDIDWQTGVIKICRASNYTKQKDTFTDTTKTAKSKQSMKFPPFVIALLGEYMAEQAEYADSLGDKWEENDRLFVGVTGRPLTTSLPYKWFDKFCKKNGLPCYGVHQYRHLFDSLLIKEGVDIVSVSGALGHTNPNITLGVYSHLIGDTQNKVTEAVTNALDFAKTKN